MKKKNKVVQKLHWGLTDYKEAWDRQEELFAETIAIKVKNRRLPDSQQIETPNYLVFCQHPPVYTLGKSGEETNLLLNEKLLNERKIAYYKINRGGDITYHGPGQVVVYPILDMDNFFTDIHQYLRLLEEAVILTLQAFHLKAGRMDSLTGVWLDYSKDDTAMSGALNPRKICAMGVRTSRWVTMHGLALNVNTDLSYFNHIIPCGIPDKPVTSMQKELGHELNMKQVEDELCKNIAYLFEMDV